VAVVRAYCEGACYKGACHKGACYEGACRKGACRKGACRKGACRKGACRKGACRKEGRISSRVGIGASFSKDVFRLSRVPLLLYRALSIIYSGGVGE
jgi:hypothetical protein